MAEEGYVFPSRGGIYTKLWRNPLLSDLTVILEDQQSIPVHRTVLYANSEFFAGYFTKHPEEREITVEGEVQYVLPLLQWMYGSRLPINKDNFLNYLFIADYLGMDGFFGCLSVVIELKRLSLFSPTLVRNLLSSDHIGVNYLISLLDNRPLDYLTSFAVEQDICQKLSRSIVLTIFQTATKVDQIKERYGKLPQ